jgi:hypothetical protein
LPEFIWQEVKKLGNLHIRYHLANNATFTVPASITINENAANADGTVVSVAFYNGSTSWPAQLSLLACFPVK